MADEFAETTDAVLWAKEFVARFGGDEGLMIAWFANAMEVGRRAGEQADPWRMKEWLALPDACFIAACDSDEIDQRGPVWLRDGSMRKACPEHWEPIFRVLGEQATWEDDAMNSEVTADV